MKFRTIIGIFLLLIATINIGCGGSKVLAGSPEDVEKQLYKDSKKAEKQAKKAKKRAYKHYWSMQSKEARKSIKKNKKRQKKKARKMK